MEVWICKIVNKVPNMPVKIRFAAFRQIKTVSGMYINTEISVDTAETIRSLLEIIRTIDLGELFVHTTKPFEIYVTGDKETWKEVWTCADLEPLEALEVRREIELLFGIRMAPI